MSNHIQFDENQFAPIRPKQPQPSWMVHFLVRKGIVENTAQATALLCVIAVVCLIGAGILMYLSQREEVVYQVEPPIEEQTSNTR